MTKQICNNKLRATQLLITKGIAKKQHLNATLDITVLVLNRIQEVPAYFVFFYT